MRNTTLPSGQDAEPRKPGITVVGHDQSTVTGFHRGGNMDITAYDECKVTLLQDQEVPATQTKFVRTTIDWAMWGTIIGGLALVVTILIAITQ